MKFAVVLVLIAVAICAANGDRLWGKATNDVFNTELLRAPAIPNQRVARQSGAMPVRNLTKEMIFDSIFLYFEFILCS